MEPVKKTAAAYLAELKSIKALMTQVEARLAKFRIAGDGADANEGSLQHVDSSHDKMSASHQVAICEKTSAAFHFVTTDLNSCLRDSRRARNGFRPRKPR